jgi:hypothetical protein
MPTIIKKIILALGLSLMKAVDLRTYAGNTATNAVTYSTSYPPFINPTPAAMQTLVTTGNGYATQRDLLEDQLKTLTANELANRNSITVGLTNWGSIVQNMTGLTIALCTQIGFGVKAEGTDNRVDMMSSSPVVVKSNQSTSKKIVLTLVNSLTTKKGKPYGAKGWIPFYQLGGIKPTVHDSMTMGIPTGKMQYTQTVGAASLGQQLYVCFVWFDGTEFIGPDSPIYSFTMI